MARVEVCTYVASHLDDPSDPGPVKIALPALRYSTTAAAASGSWCLQVHNGSALLKGLLRNVDMSRGIVYDASLGDVTP